MSDRAPGIPEPDELLPDVYQELRRVAERLMQAENAGHTLQLTALIHEAYLDLQKSDKIQAKDRSHFFRRSMRNTLIDHARGKQTLKRNRQRRVARNENMVASSQDAHNVLVVHDALEQLAKADEQLAQIAELRFFGGASHEEIAEALDISVRSAQRGWRMAKAAPGPARRSNPA